MFSEIEVGDNVNPTQFQNNATCSYCGNTGMTFLQFIS
jgi:hypothetical protein